MPTEKVSVTLDDDLVEAAREQAGTRGLSGYLNQALKRQLQRDRAIEFLEAMNEAFGPVEPAVLEEVRREWPRADGKPTRRSA